MNEDSTVHFIYNNEILSYNPKMSNWFNLVVRNIMYDNGMTGSRFVELEIIVDGRSIIRFIHDDVSLKKVDDLFVLSQYKVDFFKFKANDRLNPYKICVRPLGKTLDSIAMVFNL